jgi:hypothetical protein
MRLTRIRFRTIGRHGIAAPPLPPAADSPPGRCHATTKSGARCKLPVAPPGTGTLCVLHRCQPGPAAA